MSRVVVTGGLGLIGSAVSRELALQGHRVTIVDDGRTAITDRIPGQRLLATTVESAAEHPLWVTGDADVVIHCAAPVGPVAILHRSVLTEMIAGTEAAIRIANRNRAALLVFSSSEVYGTVSPTAGLVTPDDWSHRTEYCVGKITTEQMARRHHHETGLPTCVVRPWNVTGPAQRADSGFVIARMARQAAVGSPVTVYQPGSQQRAFMHVDDLAMLVRGLVDTTDGPPWDAVPVDAATPQNAVSMLDLADMFGTGHTIIDPTVEHGPMFREAAAGSKLPPHRPALRGWTPLDRIVADVTAAHAHQAAA